MTEPTAAGTLHLIYVGEEILLSRRAWTSWREIQDAFEGYKASLGPWVDAHVIEFLSDDHAIAPPSTEAQIAALRAGPAETITLDLDAGPWSAASMRSADFVVDKTLFGHLAGAHFYESASSVRWVEGRLRTLHARLSQGRPLMVHEPAAGGLVRLVDTKAFEAWAGKHFRNARLP